MEKSNFYQNNLLRLQKLEELQNTSWKEQIIGAQIGRFKPKSFYRFADKNLLTPSIVMNYLSNTGDTIDSFTHELKESYGDSFEEQDVVDFILKYSDYNPFKTQAMKKKKIKSAPIKKAVAVQTVMASIMKKSQPMINRVSSLVIKTADDYTTAALLISNLKAMAKQAETDKAAIVNPIKEALKKTEAHFKPFLDTVKQVESDTKAKMIAFIAANEKKSAKLMQIFEAGKIKNLETVVTKQAELADLDNSHASVRKIKEVEIVDFAQIPRKYMVPDMKLIKEALQAGQKVPGCTLTTKNSIAI